MIVGGGDADANTTSSGTEDDLASNNAEGEAVCDAPLSIVVALE